MSDVTYNDVEIDMSIVGGDGNENAQQAIDEIDETTELCFELLTCIEL